MKLKNLGRGRPPRPGRLAAIGLTAIVGLNWGAPLSAFATNATDVTIQSVRRPLTTT